MRWLVLAAVTLLACEPFFAPYENPKRTVEGCGDAVAHLRACCPAWDSYLSCTYVDHAIPSRDLTVDQSRCLGATACAEIERAVTGSRSLCGFTPATSHCR